MLLIWNGFHSDYIIPINCGKKNFEKKKKNLVFSTRSGQEKKTKCQEILFCFRDTASLLNFFSPIKYTPHLLFIAGPFSFSTNNSLNPSLRIRAPELDGLIILQCGRGNDIFGRVACGTQDDVWNAKSRANNRFGQIRLENSNKPYQCALGAFAQFLLFASSRYIPYYLPNRRQSTAEISKLSII